MTRKQLDEIADNLDKLKRALRDKGRELHSKDTDPFTPSDTAALAQTIRDNYPLGEILSLIGGPGLPTATDLTGEKPEPTGFDTFMTSLAQSMVSTQKALDQKSAEYLASITGKPHIHPSVFRLPKLEAEMKFGLEVNKETKLSMLFWGKSSSTSQQNQQSINFEMVSVPAPPGSLEEVRKALPPIWTLVVDPLARKTLLDLVKQQPADPLVKPLVDAATSDTPEDIAFLELGDGSRTLVFFAGPEKAGGGGQHNVGIWLLTRSGDSATLGVVYRFNRNLGDEEPVMYDLVRDLAKRQKRFSDGL